MTVPKSPEQQARNNTGLRLSKVTSASLPTSSMPRGGVGDVKHTNPKTHSCENISWKTPQKPMFKPLPLEYFGYRTPLRKSGGR